MNTHKRGDHLLATGLAKTLGDLAVLVAAQVGQTSEGRALLEALSQCTRQLTAGTFDAVIDRGRPVLTDDAHSLAFGEAVKSLKLEIASLAFAMKFRREIDDVDKTQRAQSLALANAHLATAKLATRLSLGRCFDSAIDEAVCQRLPAGQRGEIERLRAMLERLRLALCAVVERL